MPFPLAAAAVVVGGVVVRTAGAGLARAGAAAVTRAVAAPATQAAATRAAASSAGRAGAGRAAAGTAARTAARGSGPLMPKGVAPPKPARLPSLSPGTKSFGKGVVSGMQFSGGGGGDSGGSTPHRPTGDPVPYFQNQVNMMRGQ